MNILNLLKENPFSLDKMEKEAALLSILNELHDFHYQNSNSYQKIIDTVFAGFKVSERLIDLPFIPVSAFKNHTIKSINDTEIYKVLTSSGTTGQSVSRIYLDKETATLQTTALSKIIGHVIGKQRLPMLIVDSKSVFSNKSSFSARGAGILGLSVFGKDHTYILDEKFAVQEDVLHGFLEKYQDQPILIFGFTFMVWEYLIQNPLLRKYDLSKSILIHSGGWKRMQDIAVDNIVFRNSFLQKFGLTNIYNFYGMVEQVGSIFLENNKGFLHCPIFADIIIRNPKDFSIQPIGEPGLVQVISAIPKSYPGHSLLTEDIGVLEGENSSENEWKGKYFRILGRAKKAELRGCSDTFSTN
ncbi:MAG: hypothetical protein NW218_19490 [Saprospiraceae bacterium]|nr:hypothetical protein [Saprospiraceae bacterium]